MLAFPVCVARRKRAGGCEPRRSRHQSYGYVMRPVLRTSKYGTRRGRSEPLNPGTLLKPVCAIACWILGSPEARVPSLWLFGYTSPIVYLYGCVHGASTGIEPGRKLCGRSDSIPPNSLVGWFLLPAATWRSRWTPAAKAGANRSAANPCKTALPSAILREGRTGPVCSSQPTAAGNSEAERKEGCTGYFEPLSRSCHAACAVAWYVRSMEHVSPLALAQLSSRESCAQLAFDSSDSSCSSVSRHHAEGTKPMLNSGVPREYLHR